jgi:hypothetical protein
VTPMPERFSRLSFLNSRVRLGKGCDRLRSSEIVDGINIWRSKRIDRGIMSDNNKELPRTDCINQRAAHRRPSISYYVERSTTPALQPFQERYRSPGPSRPSAPWIASRHS